MNRDDSTIRIVVLPLDQAALLHPGDDARRAGHGDVQLLGEPAHRQRSLDLEDRQDVDVDQAQRSTEEAPEGAHPFLGVPGRHLVEQILNEALTPRIDS